MIGIDINMRSRFFGEAGDTTWNLRRLPERRRWFRHLEIDIRARAAPERETFVGAPRADEVYDIGGGQETGAAVLKAIALFETLHGKKLFLRHQLERRRGDHICHTKNTRELRSHCSGCSLSRSLIDVCEALVKSQTAMLSAR